MGGRHSTHHADVPDARRYRFERSERRPVASVEKHEGPSSQFPLSTRPSVWTPSEKGVGLLFRCLAEPNQKDGGPSRRRSCRLLGPPIESSRLSEEGAGSSFLQLNRTKRRLRLSRTRRMTRLLESSGRGELRLVTARLPEQPRAVLLAPRASTTAAVNRRDYCDEEVEGE